MTPFAIAILLIALIPTFATFWIGHRSGWHWGAALAAAAIPLAFTFFLGIIGLLIAFAFVTAVWKANY